MSQHSIYGRAVQYRASDGELLTYNPNADAVQSAGVTGQAVITAASTTGTTLKAYGINTLGGATTHTYTLPTPAGKGRIMTIVSISASTEQIATISSANGNILHGGGSSAGQNAYFKLIGAALTLRECSTFYAIVGAPSTASVHFTS